MTLRLTDEESEILRALADREKRSMHEVVRLAVLDRAARSVKDDQIRDLLERGGQRYSDLLDRLSR